MVIERNTNLKLSENKIFNLKKLGDPKLLNKKAKFTTNIFSKS